MNLSDVTAVVVFCRTPDLVDISVGSFRSFYPDMKLIIIDNSSDNEEFVQVDKRFNGPKPYISGSCTSKLKSFCNKDKNTKLFIMPENMGHGLGIHFGLENVDTSYAYIFESDTLMKKGGLIEEMLKLTNKNIYAIGRIEKGYYKDGRPITNVKMREMKLIWAYASLLSVEMYFKFPAWNSMNGTNTIPILAAMQKIDDLNKDLLVNFNVDVYVNHLFGQTRKQIGNPYISNYLFYENNFKRRIKKLLEVSAYDSVI